jgi:hypothetical protein
VTEDGTQDLDVVFALHEVALMGDGGDAALDETAARGLDIDNVCTCPGPESCKPLATRTHCDDGNGRDNALAALFAQFSTVTDLFNTAGLNASIQIGRYNLLIRIVHYNGGQNDKSVTAVVYVSDGTEGVELDGGSPSTPKFDGTDVWTVDPGSLLGGTSLVGQSCANNAACVPLYVDENAFVSGGTLVAHIDFPIALTGSTAGALAIDIVGGQIVAPIVSNGSGSFNLIGSVVAGRWKTDELLTSLQTVNDPFDKTQTLCGSDPTYQNFKPLICSYADVAADPATDNKGQPCGALSVAIGFSMAPANLGTVYTNGPKPAPCGANYSDSCN